MKPDEFNLVCTALCVGILIGMALFWYGLRWGLIPL